MKIIKPVLFPIIILGSLQSCMFFYKVQTVHNITYHEIRQYDSLNKYIILHQEDTAWLLSVIEYDKNRIIGKISLLPHDHMKYKTTDPKKANRYIKGDKNIKSKKPPETVVLDEVHIYINDTLIINHSNDDIVNIPLSGIIKVEIYQKAKGKTTLSWIIPIAGGIILTGGLIAIIWVLISQSLYFGLSGW